MSSHLPSFLVCVRCVPSSSISFLLDFRPSVSNRSKTSQPPSHHFFTSHPSLISRLFSSFLERPPSFHSPSSPHPSLTSQSTPHLIAHHSRQSSPSHRYRQLRRYSRRKEGLVVLGKGEPTRRVGESRCFRSRQDEFDGSESSSEGGLVESVEGYTWWTGAADRGGLSGGRRVGWIVKDRTGGRVGRGRRPFFAEEEATHAGQQTTPTTHLTQTTLSSQPPRLYVPFQRSPRFSLANTFLPRLRPGDPRCLADKEKYRPFGSWIEERIGEGSVQK